MTTDKPRIGFIGLGLMGSAFTGRLVACGYSVTGYDIEAEKVEAAVARGVEAATSPAEVAWASDIVQVCVTATYCVEDAVFGPGGVVEGAAPDKILVDHSTTEIPATRDMAQRLRDQTGMAWIDAPVSGGPPAAASGTLAIMAGGAGEAVERVRPVMADLAGGFTHMGAVGAGQATKMVNQVLVLTNYCVLAEALKLAENNGVDAAKIPEALASGHAGSNMLKNLFPRLVARDFAPAGFARQILKDLDMLHDVARDSRTPTPMASQAANLFRLLVSRGHGELDGIAVLKLYDEGPV